jgi:Protein of unknown function (DUF2516)
VFSFAGYGPVDYFFYALLVIAFVIEAWAFIDALRHPAGSYTAASKQSKPIWLIILGVALIIGIGGVTQEIGLFNSFLALPIVAASIYLVDVRPKVREIRARPGTRQGPYGPW